MPRKEQTPKKKTKEKSPKKSEDPKMDEAAINRLLQNALNEANARAEQNLEERLTALREEINKKHQEEMIDLQDQFAQSMVWPSLWLVSYRRAIVAQSHGWNLLEEFAK